MSRTPRAPSSTSRPIRGNVRSPGRARPDRAGHGRREGRRATATASCRPRRPRSPAARRGSAPRRCDEALALRRAGIAGPRVLTWLYAPGCAAAGGRRGRHRRVGVRCRGRSTRWPPPPARPVDRARAPQGRHRPGPQRADPGRPRDAPAGGPAAAGRGRRRASSACGRHLAFADEPEHPTVKHQGEVFADALRDGRGRRASRLEVRHLANSAATLTSPGGPLRPRPARHRRLRPLARPAARRARRLRPRAGHDRSRPSWRTSSVCPAGTASRTRHQYVTTHDTVLGAGAARVRRRDPAARVGHAGPAGRSRARRRPDARGRRAGLHGPGGASTSAPARPSRRATASSCSAPVRDGGPTAQDWAVAAGTISYEIVTRIGARVPRVHVDSEAVAR